MLSKFAAVALGASLVSAQTFTLCNPLKETCPNPPAFGAKPVDVDFRKGASNVFGLADGTSLKYDNNLGAVFRISKEGEAPTITSHRYIFFGQVDVVLRASAGVGVVTSLVLQSDDLDEIDWEWLGGDNTQVQTNYFSKGCDTVFDRGGIHAVSSPVTEFHTYTIKWTQEAIEWIVNGAVIRRLENKGLSGCSGFPQSPMQVKLGTWVAGLASAPPGRIEWAGGVTNFAEGPFEGYYQSVRIVDYMGGASSAKEYRYTDRSGTWESIEVIADNGTGTKPSSTAAPSSTAKPSSSTAASSASSTLSTVVSSSSSAEPSASQSSSPSGTPSNGTSTTPSPSGPPSGAPTGAAGKVNAGGFAAVAVAALFGYLAL